MSNSTLQFKKVSFRYESKNNDINPSIIESLSFTIHSSEFVSILGPSGSGKTTLFKLITGLEQPSSGDILLNGKYMKNRLGCVGYMPQKDLLLPWRTILQNASLPLELRGVKKKVAYQQVIELLEEFGLKGLEDELPSVLSGGMKQRVSFLRSILSGANLLLLDEPFSSLDAITRLSMQEWLLNLWEKRKTTVLFITHDVDEALFLSDRIFVLSETPVRHLKEVPIPLRRPRGINDLHLPEIIKLKEDLLNQLRQKVRL
ncbi:ABC transporter ATP-binding protein [Evansella tamaricis]|uniref:ABC transporter ATP-binding protein n=1 Tax=Evansella tamaricis TaxID=2069301 RepID=A0ABS6JKE9_9BACI|nr:ABC transporter ATP-binding protein [Evansella tamaricis]MBU9714018.1 ABC transporter ATP-binding protein [Evansella tamaricis]